MAGPNGLAPSAGWPALGRPAIASASSDPLVASFPSPLFSSRSLTAEVTCRAEAASRSLRHPVGGTAPLHQRVALVCRASAQDRGNESSSDDKGAAEDNEKAEVEGDVAEEDEQASVSSAEFRERMEALVENQGKDEAYFDGKELARIIFGKYGRSYDVTFMRQEFMGRKLLAMNVMWKYREQKSFPLTEEEYLYRLDRVAENLRFWGAVGIVRESLAATKERPRIGKAVSIRIDLDETGERAREWINR